MRAFVNFGGNLRWLARRERPASEAQVLELLRRHRDGQVRAIGALHSWSGTAPSSGVSLDLSAFDAVEPFERDGGHFVRAGAGCTLQSLLERLHAATERTLPTLGVIKRQTVAGAISTGTHGSGMQSLSHFVAGVRLARYRSDGEPEIVDVREGAALLAARCGLGCTGILLEIELATVPKYLVEERVRLESSLGAILGGIDEFPLTQFALFPFAWSYLVFERRAGHGSLPLAARAWARLCRWLNTLYVDIGLHASLKASLAFGNRAAKLAMRVTPRLTPRLRRIDDAEHVLTMRHDLFRHEEMELFVPQARLAEALALLRHATEIFAGEAGSPEVAGKLDARLRESLLKRRDSYTHHYPYSMRRVLPEDALVSMASSVDEPLWSISVFCYLRPEARAPYYAFCAWLAHAFFALYSARLHWGKHFPLGLDETTRAYPRLEELQAVAVAADPRGVFRNAFTHRAVGLKPRLRMFEPFKIKGVEFKNRLVRSSMGGRSAYYDGTVNNAWKNFELRFAHTDVAAIISATLAVDDDRHSPLEYPKISHDRFVPALREGVRAVQALGCRYIAQIGDPGGQTQTSLFSQREDALSASAWFDLLYGYRNRAIAMTTREVEKTVTKFAAAAARVHAAGCDGVEVTASKGYLIHQFLNPGTNWRTDRYGGSFEARFRLLREVVQAVRKAVGADFLFGVRLSAEDFNHLPRPRLRWPIKRGNGLAQTLEYGRWLKELGVDYLHIDSGFGFINPKGSPGRFPFESIRLFANSSRHLSAKAQARALGVNLLGLLGLHGLLSFGWRWAEAPNARYAAAFRAEVGLPVIANGGFGRAETIEAALDGQCDLVAMARPLLANPDLLAHFRRGSEPTAPCTGCNQCCTRTAVLPLGCYERARFASQQEMEAQILQWSANPRL